MNFKKRQKILSDIGGIGKLRTVIDHTLPLALLIGDKYSQYFVNDTGMLIARGINGKRGFITAHTFWQFDIKKCQWTEMPWNFTHHRNYHLSEVRQLHEYFTKTLVNFGELNVP